MNCRVQKCRFPRSHATEGHRCGGCGQLGHGRLECPLRGPAPHSKKRKRSDRESPLPALAVSKVICPLCRCPNFMAGPPSPSDGRGRPDEAACCVCLDQPPAGPLPQCGHCCLCLPCLTQLSQPIEARLRDSLREVSVSFGDSLREVSVSFGDSLREVSVSSRDSQRRLRDGAGLAELVYEALSAGGDRPSYTSVPIGLGGTLYARRLSRGHPVQWLTMGSDDWGQYGDRFQLERLHAFIAGYTQCPAPDRGA